MEIKLIEFIPPDKKITLKIGDPYMTTESGRKEIYAGEKVSPVIISERTFLPVRALVEEMGGTVEWKDSEQKVTVKYGGNVVETWVSSTKIIVNGKQNAMDVTALLVDGRVLLPIRYIIDNLGLELQWDGIIQEMKIVY